MQVGGRDNNIGLGEGWGLCWWGRDRVCGGPMGEGSICTAVG